MGDDRVQGAIFVEPLGRGLGPYLGHAGDVVGGVAHQGQVIDDALGRHTEFCHHAGRIQQGVAHGVDEGHLLVHQLRHVLVAGGDEGVPALARGLARQGADDIVRLHPGHLQQGQSHGAHQGMQGIDLGAQFLGHGRPVGLVLGEQFVAEGLALGIEYHGNLFRRIVVDQFAQHIGHAVHGPGGFAPGIGQRWQCVKGTVQIGRSIHQDKGVGFVHWVGLPARFRRGKTAMVSLRPGVHANGMKFAPNTV